MSFSSSRSLRACATATLVALAGLASPADALEMAQSPLFLSSDAKPNFILALDDSTSMFLERTYPGGDPPFIYWNAENNSPFVTNQPGVLYTNDTGDGAAYPATAMFDKRIIGEIALPIDAYAFARSPDFNGLYFNPFRTYHPWLKYDGSRWPDADATHVRMDPRAGNDYSPLNTYTYDLTDQKGTSITTFLESGMVISAGSEYSSRSYKYIDPNDYTELDPVSNCGAEIPPIVEPIDLGQYPDQPGKEQWKTLDVDVTIETADPDGDGDVNQCALWLRYFPATFYLKNPASLPADYGYVAAPKEVVNAFGPPVSESLWRYEIRPENFASALQYQTAIGNFANYMQYHRSRFLATIAAITEALADIKNVRLGSFKINDRINVVMRDMSVPLQRQAAYMALTGFQSTAALQGDLNLSTKGTPNRDAVAHIGEQYKRNDSDAPIQKACQVNSGMLFTDGYTTKNNGPIGYGNADGSLDVPFRDSHSNTMADIVTSYYEGAKTPLRPDLPLGKVPTPASCKDKPEPWVDCSTDLHMKFYGVALGPQGLIYGVDPAATENPFLNPPNWNAYGSPKTTDGPVVVDELWHAALNGRGAFVSATTPEDVTTAIKSALAQTVGTASFGGVSASGSRRTDGFLAYVPRYTQEDWSGDLTAHISGTEGQFDQQVWSAAEKLEAMDPTDRNVFFSDAGVDLKPLTVDALGGEEQAADRLGLPSVKPFNATVADVVNYLRGEHALEMKSPGGVFRDRSSRIGDIFGSQPEVLTQAGFGYTGLPQNQGGGTSGPGSYGDFMQTTKKTRTPVVFVGANDGMLHAFDASAGANGGKEIFAIVPNSVLGNMGKLADPAYQHRYFVDGSPVQGDAWNGSWKTVLLAPMGAGGKSIMALDVTDPVSSFSSENLLWEFTDPDLKETLGKPHIVLLESGKWVAVFASGIAESLAYTEQKQYVYFVDLFSGQLLAKVPTSSVPEDVTLDDGIINVVPVDSDFDLRADTVYMADYDAYLWRIDIQQDGKFVLGNGGKPLFRGSGKGGRPQTVTGGIDSFPHHLRGQMVFFGTGRYLHSADNIATQERQETFYGFWDDPQSPGTFARSSLQEQDILANENADGVEARRVTDSPVDWSTKRGWALELVVKGALYEGERVIGHPTVALGRVTFPTFTPVGGQESSCSGGGLSRIYSLSATNGVGEYALLGGEGTYGSITIPASKAGAGPILAPTIVTSPPPPPCNPGDPGCPLLTPDEEGVVTPAPSEGCKTPLGLLLGDGLLTFDHLTCGRQSWQQSR